MKKILCLTLMLLIVCGMLAFAASAYEEIVYVDYVKGNDTYDGLSADMPKKSIDNNRKGAMFYTKENGGKIIVTGKLYFGNDYTIKTNRGGLTTITANDGNINYIDPRPATNPAGGSMKMAKGKNLTIASDVTLTDVILFHEYDDAPSTIFVKDGATLTITDTVECMSKGSKYYSIVVEAGATAIIEGGTYSSITGNGTIKKSDSVILSAGYVDPNQGKPGTVFLNYGDGNDGNDGNTAGTPKKLFGTVAGVGAMSKVKYGGTIIVSGKAYMGSDYTLKDHEGPVTMTSFYDGVDYKNSEPVQNPACAFKMAKEKTLTVESDFTFDNIIVFNEYGNGTIKVAKGATFTVTDTVVFMNKYDTGYTLIIDSGAKAVLSEDAQRELAIRNNGGEIITYVPAAKPVEKTEVKLTIGSATAYINGKAQTLDAAPINRNNRTLLPVRFLANAFGVDNDGIKWDGATSTATLSNKDTTIVVKIGAPSMTVNGETVALDSPAIIESGRTYLPVRAIANALGVTNENIKWDAATSTATLVK